MNKQIDVFELFWENSKLNRKTIREFSKRIEAYTGEATASQSLLFPAADIRLNRSHDPLMQTMRRRKSIREFSNKTISFKKLSSLFAAFMKTDHGGRTYASAGATYALEVFCILHHVDRELNKKIVYYNVDNHSLTIVKEAPDFDTYKDMINVDTKSTIPAVVFVFTLASDRTTDKYGERGGRFVLLELGHAVQNLSLRLAYEGIGGVEAGGLLDDRIAELLGIQSYPLKIASGYLCGYPLVSSNNHEVT